MPTTVVPPPPAAEPAAAPHAASGHPSTLDAVRAFGVMLGGPLALLSAAAASAAHCVGAARRRRLPSPGVVAVLGGAIAYQRRLRPWMRTWGASDAEVVMTLPGDELSPRPAFQQTHVVRIGAPAAEVWAWIAQIGQDRGGFYSYTWLENLAGCRMHNADRIHPEWQVRSVGETVRLHPAAGLKVLRLQPGRTLVLEGGWSMHVADDGPDSCRLIARFRAPAGVAGSAYGLLLELPHFLMERRMLLEVKRRAEARA